MVGDGAVDGVAAARWFDDLDVSPTIEDPRLRAAWATGQLADDLCLGEVLRICSRDGRGQ